MSPRTRSSIYRVVVYLIAVVAGGCASTTTIEQGSTQSTAQALVHENLNSVLWVQSSVEYAAVTEQAYRQAQGVLSDALSDKNWSASLEQVAEGGFGELPPAVVLDVDETVLDNSAYQARLILDGETYNTQSWNDWVREEASSEVPGALAFTRHADRLGIAVIYLTNRRSEVEEATRRNLANLGFPLDESTDVILTRGEREEWSASDKTPRREYLADRYRMLLLVGDNLGDFMGGDDRSPLERKESAAPYNDYWGTRWIMLPNPQYGSWEEAAIDYDYSVPAEVQLRRKLQSLHPHR